MIIGVLAINLAFTSKSNPLKAEIRETLGGPVEEKSLIENYGDSLAAISNNFQETSIIEINLALNSDALSQTNSINHPTKKKNLGYFAPPTIGWNWGVLHKNNAVDIANRCDTPIYASAEGIAVADKELGSGSDGWNDGYGIFILLEHQNYTQTRYAHLEKTVIQIGKYVKKGDLIGYMGNTGNTHGPTGCHLHFEVYGAENPLAK